MNTNHTPGPWKVNEDGWVIGANGETIVSHHPMTYLDETAQADARLIAATPELLDALQAILTNNDISRNDWSEDTMAVLHNASAVIAKATQS